MRRALALTSCLVCLLALPARADALADAEKLVEDLEYQNALKLLDSIEKGEGLDQKSLARVWLLQGVCFGTLGKEAKTRDAFRKLLSVAPDATLPNDLPPRVRTPFFEAREWLDTNGKLGATPSFRADGTTAHLKLTVSGDVLRLAKSVRFQARGDDAPEKVEEVPLTAGVAELTLPGARVKWSAQVLSERRHVLLEVAARDDGAAPVAAVTPPLETTREVSGGWRRPVGITFLVLGAVAGGVGVAFGVNSSATRAKVTGATKDDTGKVVSLTQVQAAALEANAKQDALIANVLFAAGGTLGAAGLVLTIVGPSGEPVAQLTPFGAGLQLAGSF